MPCGGGRERGRWCILHHITSAIMIIAVVSVYHPPSSVCVIGSCRNSFENSGVKHALPLRSFGLKCCSHEHAELTFLPPRAPAHCRRKSLPKLKLDDWRQLPRPARDHVPANANGSEHHVRKPTLVADPWPPSHAPLNARPIRICLLRKLLPLQRRICQLLRSHRLPRVVQRPKP